jgi:ABC-type phosphate/phosphonate transport system substrate-binding protein
VSSISFTDSWNDVAATVVLYKNGAAHRTLWKGNHMTTLDLSTVEGSAIVQANGTTDYFEVFIINADVARNVQGRFEGHLLVAT